MTDARAVTDADYGKVSRKTWEIERRVKDGTLDPQETADRLQLIIENADPYPTLPTVTSDGRTGVEFLIALKQSGVVLTDWAENVLGQDEFDEHHTSDGSEYNFEVIPGSAFTDNERTTGNIRRVGTKERGLGELLAEAGALLAEKISVEDFKQLEAEHGIKYLVVMHPAITGSVGAPSLLCLYRCGDELRLDADWGIPEFRWLAEGGFVFLSRT